MTADELKALVRTVPDFPAPGILFRDITTLIGARRRACAPRSAIWPSARAARGAGDRRDRGARLHLRRGGRGRSWGWASCRCASPASCRCRRSAIDYALEYGTDRLEIDPGAIAPGERVVIVDDLIATGGTALAAAELLRQAGAVVEHALFVIDLPDLGGAARLREAGVAVER